MEQAAGSLTLEKTNVFGELLKIALEHYSGDTTKAKAAMSDYINSVIKTLSKSEKENFSERAAIMEYDGGLSHEEAEAEALDIITRKRPFFTKVGSSESWKKNPAANAPPGRHTRGGGLEGLRTFARKEWK
jgi:hypothetical protein